MSYSVQNIRNVCLLGHSGNGKTALAESLLYMTGAIERMGRVADGNTVCDYDPEETKRQISLSTSVAPLEYKGCRINVLDTPGAFDFSGEVMEALRAADAAIIVCSAKDGISVGLEKAWKYCEERNMPRFIYISKTDEDNSDYNATFEALRERFGKKIAPVVVPIWDANKKVTGIIDVLNKRAYEMQNLKRVEIEVPADKVDVITEFNDALKESLALQLVAVLLGVGQHLKVQVYHVLAGPHGLAVMCRILVIEPLGCQLQRHLVLVVVAAVVAAQTDEDTRLPVRQARGIGQQGIGMHEELQVLVLPHVEAHVLVDGLGL